MKVVGKAICLFLIAVVAISAAPRGSKAASAAEIDADVDATLNSFEAQVQGARELAIKAAGILVFPSVVKAELDLAANMARDF
jgi:lipid-binding SYLF domain-containing protein